MRRGEARGGRGRRGRRAALWAAALAAALALAALPFVRPGWSGGPTLAPRFDLSRFATTLAGQLPWLGPFAALAALLPALRAHVWRTVIPRPRPAWREAYHATALGALVHNAMPGKLGPFAAAWVLARSMGRPVGPALGAQLVSKLLELGALVAAGALAAISRGGAGPLGEVVLAGAGLFVALASAAAMTALAAPALGRRVGRRLPRAGEALGALGDGLRGAGGGGRVAAGLALSLLPALGSAAAYALPLNAAGVASPLTGGALLVAVIAFGQLTPGLPVGAGVYWSLAAWAARTLGVPAGDAAAIAVATHAGMVGASLAVGAVSAVARRALLSSLLRRPRPSDEGENPGDR